ncbi:MAG: shikimate kinase [Clostridia bacterium]|nr:shikimate kinase [Clostridia bacterium]
MDNIILIGMPSCGKSTLGRILAKELNYGYVDTDDVIIRQNGCPLRDILDREGVDGFVRREEEAICSVQAQRTVIATGGSAIYSEKAMAHLKALGRVVYLCLTFDEVERRLGDLHARGVAIAPGSTLQDLFNERVPLYEKYADLTVHIRDGNSVRQSVAVLLQQL